MRIKKQIAFLFPGQGAQYPGMGRSFFETFKEAKEVFQEADDLLGENLSKLIFEGPEGVLTETKNSQVAIFVVSYALLSVVKNQFPDLNPNFVSGLSLGEYTALVASGRLSFQEGLRLVRERGLAMHQACFERPGSMSVVLGMSGDGVASCVASMGLDEDLWVANYNAPGQVVISGTLFGLEQASRLLLEKGAKRVMPLQVAGPFHSGLMSSAREKLSPLIDRISFKQSEISFVMNVPGDVVGDGTLIPKFLKEQVNQSVRWEQGVRAMDRLGVDLYIEIGCGRVLAGLNKKIAVLGKTITIEKIEDLEGLAQGLEG